MSGEQVYRYRKSGLTSGSVLLIAGITYTGLFMEKFVYWTFCVAESREDVTDACS